MTRVHDRTGGHPSGNRYPVCQVFLIFVDQLCAQHPGEHGNQLRFILASIAGSCDIDVANPSLLKSRSCLNGGRGRPVTKTDVREIAQRWVENRIRHRIPADSRVVAPNDWSLMQTLKVQCFISYCAYPKISAAAPVGKLEKRVPLVAWSATVICQTAVQIHRRRIGQGCHTKRDFKILEKWKNDDQWNAQDSNLSEMASGAVREVKIAPTINPR